MCLLNFERLNYIDGMYIEEFKQNIISYEYEDEGDFLGEEK